MVRFFPVFTLTIRDTYWPPSRSFQITSSFVPGSHCSMQPCCQHHAFDSPNVLPSGDRSILRIDVERHSLKELQQARLKLQLAVEDLDEALGGRAVEIAGHPDDDDAFRRGFHRESDRSICQLHRRPLSPRLIVPVVE